MAMSVPCRFERSLLSHEEYETIRLTHHPAIYDVETAELEAMRSRLRKMRDKERTLGRQRRREERGKAEARGASFPGQEEKTDQSSPHGAPRPTHRRPNPCEIHGLLDMNLATLVTLDHTSVLQIDQIFLLQRAEFIQHLIGGVNAIEVKDHQIAHDQILLGP